MSPPRVAAPRIAAVVLAAGRSTRMGGANKLLAEVGGETLIARVVKAAAASRAEPVIVVTGHEAETVRAALAGEDVTFADNPDYAEGLSSSLRAGLAALPGDVDGALICLGDMPHVDAALIDRLIAAFDPAGGCEICVPMHRGKRGNPVLWGRRFFAQMAAIEGDRGARDLIGRHAGVMREIEAGEGCLIDVDTPDGLDALGDG